jgi:hypothetical protein
MHDGPGLRWTGLLQRAVSMHARLGSDSPPPARCSRALSSSLFTVAVRVSARERTVLSRRMDGPFRMYYHCRPSFVPSSDPCLPL